MRSVDEWFDRYSQDHRNPTNRFIHWIGVPAILWSLMVALWVIPVPPSVGRPGFWCGMAMVAAFAFYWKLSKPVGLAMLAVFVVFGLLTEYLYRMLGPHDLFRIAAGVFVAAAIGLFVGHRIEGGRPSFLGDPKYLLIAPAWLAGRIMRRFDIAW